MHNLATVIRFELVRTLKKPSFWISVLAIPVLIGIVFAIIFFTNRTSEENQAANLQEPFSLIVKDETGLISDQALATLDAERISTTEEGIAQVKSGAVEAFYYYPENIAKQGIQVYNQNNGLIDNGKYTELAGMLLQNSVSTSVDPNILSIVQGEVATQQVNFENGEEVNLIGGLIGPAIFLVIFYAVIVLLGGQMLASTTEEKENRVTEMLLTSLSSRALIVGKIISLILLGCIQIATILIPALLAYFFAREALSIPDVSNIVSQIRFELWPTVIGAGLLVSGFLLFTGLLVGIGAATPTAKEANSFFGFVILLMFIPFYFFSLLMTDVESPIVTALSFFPLTAPVTLMIRNTFGTLETVEGLIGLGIVFVSGIIAINLAIRIFRYGTLEYSKRLSLSTIFKSKKKNA